MQSGSLDAEFLVTYLPQLTLDGTLIGSHGSLPIVAQSIGHRSSLNRFLFTRLWSLYTCTHTHMCPAFCGNKSLQSQRNLEKRPDISTVSRWWPAWRLGAAVDEPWFWTRPRCWSLCCFPLEKDYMFLDQKGCFSRKKIWEMLDWSYKERNFLDYIQQRLCW